MLCLGCDNGFACLVGFSKISNVDGAYNMTAYIKIDWNAHKNGDRFIVYSNDWRNLPDDFIKQLPERGKTKKGRPKKNTSAIKKL